MKSYLTGGKRIIKFLQATENVKVNYLTKQVAYGFYKFHTCFFLSMLKIQTRCTYLWRHKDGKTQCKNHVTTHHGCKNLTHTSKTQAKPTQMFATARFTIRMFVTFSDCEELNATKPSRERLWGWKQNCSQKIFNRVLYIWAKGLDILKIR